MLFNETKIFIDIINNNKSKERFDMKIKISDDKSFAIECFENHHKNKYDDDYVIEINRLLYKKYLEPDIKFIVVFWCIDILDSEKFYYKFDLIKNQFDIHNKTKRDYSIEKLNNNITNIKLCEMIYDSYKNKNDAIIRIKDINKQFNFKKNMKKKFFKSFNFKLKNIFYEKKKLINNILSNDNELDFLDSDNENENENEKKNIKNDIDNIDDELKEFLSEFYICDKLTFKGLYYYVNNLSHDDYLESEIDKFNIIEWCKNIMSSLIESFENAYDNLSNINYDNFIFGLKK